MVKKAAVKALIIMLVFGVLTSGIGMLDNLLNLFSYIIGWFGKNISVRLPLNIEDILRNVFVLVEDGLFILLGLRSFTQGTVKIGFIDDLVSKHS